MTGVKAVTALEKVGGGAVMDDEVATMAGKLQLTMLEEDAHEATPRSQAA